MPGRGNSYSRNPLFVMVKLAPIIMGDPLHCSRLVYGKKRKEVREKRLRGLISGDGEVVSSWVSLLKNESQVSWTWARYLSSTSTVEFTLITKREEA